MRGQEDENTQLLFQGTYNPKGRHLPPITIQLNDEHDVGVAGGSWMVSPLRQGGPTGLSPSRRALTVS